MKGPFRDATSPTPSLVVLSGLDGSGKSTQTALLAGRLVADGIPATVIWNRWKPFLSSGAIRLAKRYLKARSRVNDGDYRGFTDAKRRSMKSAWKRALWQSMVWGEYAIQVHARLLARRRSGLAILCDRYVYDTLVDVAINFSLPADRIGELMDHPLLSLFPKPGLVVFLDIDPETGAARKSDGTPAAYLADRREYYAALSRVLRAPLVDGNADVESVARSIWELAKPWRESRSGSRLGAGNRGECS
jgi:thymidylate kinase